jgi:hypothetical protein
MVRTIALVALFASLLCVLRADANPQPMLCLVDRPCPPYDSRPPGVGPAAKRAYLKAIAAGLEDKQVIDRRNGRFTVVTPPYWSETAEPPLGWCVMETWHYPENTHLYYHAKLDEKSCLAEKHAAEKPTFFQPFDAYPDRILCDSATTHRCVEAANTLKALAQRDLANDSTVFFGDESMRRARQRLHDYFAGDVGRTGGIVLVDERYYPQAFGV